MNYTHVLYHAGCQDGFGAAWAAWKKFGDKAQYLPTIHGEPFPELPADADVLMVDMAYPRERHLELEKRVKSLTVVDHHISNMKGISDLPNTHFDLNHSGATLTWMFLHPETPTPEILLYVEDRDLWRYKLPDSHEIYMALSSYEKKFELWEMLSGMGVRNLKQDGEALLRLQKQKVNEMCESVFWTVIDGHRVPVVNCTCFTSEVGERLGQLYPEAPFTAFFYDKEKIRCWGLRSTKIDVSEIAKKFGGGGHRAAAGFTTPKVEEAAQDLAGDMRGRINDAGGEAIYNPGMMTALERLEKALGESSIDRRAE